MANLNKVQLIGRLGADPELKDFNSGGRVAKMRIAVNNRVKNQQSGEWEDQAVWLDVKAFNRESGRKLADLCEQYLAKGSQVYFEGKLIVEEWADRDSGSKRSKVVIVVDDMQFLDSKRDGEQRGQQGQRGQQEQKSRPSNGGGSKKPASPPPDDDGDGDDGGDGENDIPF